MYVERFDVAPASVNVAPLTAKFPATVTVSVKDEPVEEIQGREGSKQRGELHGKESEVRFRPFLAIPRGDHGDRSQQSRQQQDQQTHSVDAHEIIYAQPWNPSRLLDELEATRYTSQLVECYELVQQVLPG